ncbi:MAG TPA: hypothetical protein VGL89_08925 [Candidatus Koribacter sp.]|jgi:hypothetical protein
MPQAAKAKESPEKQLAGFIAKFDPKMARVIRGCRTALQRRFSTANEIVYDNYNFFVIGYSPTERPSDTIVSLAANSKGVGLAFYWGATLPDPHGILQGSGNQNRFIRLVDGAATLARAEVQDLMDAAVAQARAPLSTSGKGKLIIKSIAAKQRPRR